MEIELNGAPHAVSENFNVQDLIASLELAGKSLAVAVNREVVPRQRWAEHVLRAGDKEDVVNVIGGG